MKYKTFRNFIFYPSCFLSVAALFGACWACNNHTTRESAPAPTASAPAIPAQGTPVGQPGVAPVTAPSPSSPTSNAAAQVATDRRVDQLIVDYLTTHANAATDKVKDAFPGESFKVNIYHDEGNAGWNRLKVDLDRDEQDDEKWTLENGMPAKRQVSTKDDGTYDREYRWQGGKWVEKVK
jgi:hypothetical protein